MARRPLPAIALVPSLLLALATAGCTGLPSADDGAQDAPVPAIPLDLHLSGCTGFLASAPFVPDAVSPAQPPEGWPAGENPHSELHLLGLDCARIALGGLERPVRLLLETHGNLQPPAGCLRGNELGTVALALHGAWTDDAEVAAFLAQSYGMPAALADFREEAADLGGVRIRTWRWTPEGGSTSELTVPEGSGRMADSTPERLYWPRDTGDGSLGTGSLLLSYTRSWSGIGPTGAAMQGEGTMADPMLMAGLPGGRFAGPVKQFPDLQADGTFALFRDRLCERAEPPEGGA